MTLHEAVRTIVLRQGGYIATAHEISEEIEVESLYGRRHGTFAKAQQVNAGVRRHPQWFEFAKPGGVRFVGTR